MTHLTDILKPLASLHSNNMRSHRWIAVSAAVALTLASSASIARPRQSLKEKTKAAGNSAELDPNGFVERSAAAGSKSADQGFVRMYVSHPHLPGGKKAKAAATGFSVVSPVNLSKVEVDAMRDFIAGCQAPCKDRSIILVRFEEGIDLVTEQLIAAAKKGFKRVALVTDLNVSMKPNKLPNIRRGTKAARGAGGAGPSYSVDFATAVAEQGNPMAAQVAELVGFQGKKAGKLFTYNGEPYGIFSQPLYPSRAPIMHEKELYLIDAADKVTPIRMYYGTSNMTGVAEEDEKSSRSTRYNRLIQIDDQAIAAAGVEHVEAMIGAFRAGKQIKEITDKPYWNRIIYPDGSYAEPMFSDGRFNTNDRITTLFRRAHKDYKPSRKDGRDGPVQLKDVIFSHFVYTHPAQVEALRQAMAHQPDFKVRGVFDVSFADPNGFGVSPALLGLMTTRMNRDKSAIGAEAAGIAPFPLEWKGRMSELYMYQRPLAKIKNPVLPWHMWHDKTTIITVNESGQEWVYLFTGSFNNSMNKANAEMQILYRLKGDSAIAQAFKDSVLGAIANETQPPSLGVECKAEGDDGRGCALPFTLASLRLAVGHIAGKAAYRISVKQIDDIRKALEDGTFSNVTTLMRAIASVEANGKPRKPTAMTEERIKRVGLFLDWYGKNLPGKGIGTEYFLSACLVLTKPKLVVKDGRFGPTVVGYALSDRFAGAQLTSKSAEALALLTLPPRHLDQADADDPAEGTAEDIAK